MPNDRRHDLVAAAMFVLSALYGCGREEADIALVPVIAESDEIPIPESGQLIERCLRNAQALASGTNSKLGDPKFTHSARWGDILRIDFISEEIWSTRMACTGTANVVGVVPTGVEELVPSRMQGQWGRDGKCVEPLDRLIITATAAQFGTGQSYEIRYFRDRDTADQGRLWASNATWYVPEYDAAKDVMVWSDKSGLTTYYRCQSAN